MPGKKRGSRRFNSAVSAEKNKDKIDDFISDVIQGVVDEKIELATVDKALSNSRWTIKYYTKTKDNQIHEHIHQATKAGNLLKSAAPIMAGSVVMIENASLNDSPQFIIKCVFSKENIKDFKKVYETSYERVLMKLKNKEHFDEKGNLYRIFWVDERIFNQDLSGNNNEDSLGGVIFSYSDNEEEPEEIIKPVEKPVKRTFKTISHATKDDELEVDIDNI